MAKVEKPFQCFECKKKFAAMDEVSLHQCWVRVREEEKAKKEREAEREARPECHCSTGFCDFHEGNAW